MIGPQVPRFPKTTYIAGGGHFASSLCSDRYHP
jgi:hypothetical protein